MAFSTVCKNTVGNQHIYTAGIIITRIIMTMIIIQQEMLKERIQKCNQAVHNASVNTTRDTKKA